jgi:hypothetical protein
MENKVAYPYHDRETKKAWARSVKVGDIICNCSYEHLKVIEKLPCCKRKGGCDCNIYNMMVTLEDGTMCNLMNCADAVPHPDDWHNEEYGEEEEIES